jgi:hypothetical protein
MLHSTVHALFRAVPAAAELLWPWPCATCSVARAAAAVACAVCSQDCSAPADVLLVQVWWNACTPKAPASASVTSWTDATTLGASSALCALNSMPRHDSLSALLQLGPWVLLLLNGLTAPATSAVHAVQPDGVLLVCTALIVVSAQELRSTPRTGEASNATAAANSDGPEIIAAARGCLELETAAEQYCHPYCSSQGPKHTCTPQHKQHNDKSSASVGFCVLISCDVLQSVGGRTAAEQMSGMPSTRSNCGRGHACFQPTPPSEHSEHSLEHPAAVITHPSWLRALTAFSAAAEFVPTPSVLVSQDPNSAVAA